LRGYVNPPIVRACTVVYDDVGTMKVSQADPLRRSLPAYGRFGTPTTRAFEAVLSELSPSRRTSTTSTDGSPSRTTAVTLSLSSSSRRAECIQLELDPVDEPRNVTREFPMLGRNYTAAAMSNGWTAVFREITERTLGFAHGKTIVIFDLLSPNSSPTSVQRSISSS
jgi:hypothetical protein